MPIQPKKNLSADQRHPTSAATSWPLATVPTPAPFAEEDAPRGLLIATADGTITVEGYDLVQVTIPVVNGERIPLSPRRIMAVTACTVHLLY